MTRDYETTSPAASDTGHGRAMGEVNVGIATVTPTDRVRWGPVLAGLFAALSTLVVLSVLGAAVAGSTFDPGDRARTYGIGSGVWAAVSMLIAFGIGGWLAARSAAVRGHGDGVLNGAMVWVVAIPLMLWMISAAVGSAARAANSAAQTGAQLAQAAGQVMDDQAVPASARQEADQAGQQAEDTVRQVTQGVQSGQGRQAVQQAGSPENQERAADAVAWGAWSTLIALLLSLAAAAAGGYLGARTSDRERDRRHAAVTPA